MTEPDPELRRWRDVDATSIIVTLIHEAEDSADAALWAEGFLAAVKHDPQLISNAEQVKGWFAMAMISAMKLR